MLFVADPPHRPRATGMAAEHPGVDQTFSVRATVARSLKFSCGATVAHTSPSVRARSSPSMATHTAAVAVSGVVRLIR
jgi:hypothetical protein